jgi:sensor domain CHASE-containing protein
MTLRVKVAFLIVASFAIALIAIHFVAHNVLVASYASLEAQFVRTNVDQVWHAIDARRASLDATTNDWASWDDAYDFMETGSPDFIDSNMVDSTFSTIGVSIMVMLEPSGRARYAKAMDLTEEREVPAPSDLFAHLTPDGPVLSAALRGEAVSGLLSLNDGPVLISSHPILASDDSGPPRGMFLMAAFLGQDMVADIEEVTCLPLVLSTIRSSSPGAVLQQVPHPALEEVAILPRGPNRVEGVFTLRDIYGEPVITAGVARERTVYAEGQRTLTFFLSVVAIGGLLVTALFLLLLDRTLLRRLSRLATEVQSIGEHPEFSGEITITGNDELSFLGHAINETLSALTRAHHQLADSNRSLEQTNAELKRAKQDLTSSAAQLRRLTRHLQTMREDERVLVANEIHDQVGQGLTAIKMDLATLQRANARGDAPSPEMLQRLSAVVDTLAETVRRLSTGLRPSMLEDLGLAEALEWHISEFGRERAMKTSLRIQGPAGNVEESRALAIFRILQEALLVCADDPTTSEVAVNVTIETRYALLAVRDNGAGISSGDLLSKREVSLGLIRERAEVFGGGVTFDTTAGSGTSIVAQVPF